MNPKNLARALKALADENRMRIVRLLSEGPLKVGMISERLMISGYDASKHLRVLREAGLLECNRHGRERHYSIPKPLRPQLDSGHPKLDLGCCSFELEQFPR